MSRFRPTSNVPPPVAYVGTASVAESLERIAGTLERIHSTLQFHGHALDGVSNTLETLCAVAQSVREPVKHDDIVSRAKHVVAKAEREAVARDAAERKFRYAAEKIRRKPRRKAVAKRVNTRQPSED